MSLLLLFSVAVDAAVVDVAATAVAVSAAFAAKQWSMASCRY